MGPGVRFKRVYATREGSVGNVLSGPLARASSCGALLEWLEGLADEGLRTVLDLGCGDLEWISRSDAIVSGRLDYQGIELIPELIEHHRRVFPWFRGECVEDVEAYTNTRRIDADVVILKEVLEFHCNGMAAQTLSGIAKPSSRWQRLLISSQPGAPLRHRRGLHAGTSQSPLDVEALLRQEFPLDSAPLGAIAHRFARPAGGEWLEFRRDGERLLAKCE